MTDSSVQDPKPPVSEAEPKTQNGEASGQAREAGTGGSSSDNPKTCPERSEGSKIKNPKSYARHVGPATITLLRYIMGRRLSSKSYTRG
jgi:hypothetical protein